MKVGLLGHNGKMGKILTQKLQEKGCDVIFLSFDKKQLFSQLQSCQVAMEFSSSTGLELLLDTASIPLVLASTGLEASLKEKIVQKSQKIPIFYSANYSLGMNTLIHLLKNSSLESSKASISEVHHIHKKDAPSGTALMIKEFLEIKEPIKSIREGDVFGEHEIVYHLSGEKLIFKHVALGRDVFAEGAMAAVKWIVCQKQGLYSMNDLLAL
jgi:4-hydroxy-tetrahydrodipicolinate reductase